MHYGALHFLPLILTDVFLAMLRTVVFLFFLSWKHLLAL